MSTPNSEMPHTRLNGAEKSLPTEAPLIRPSVDAEVVAQMNARMLQLEGSLKSQQETITHHQKFMDKQLSMLMPQNAPALPTIAPEDVPSKVAKHPISSSVLAYYLIGTIGAIAASIVSSVRHSPDAICAVLLYSGAILSILSTAYVVFSMVINRTTDASIRILPNLSMGLACISILAGLTHLLWFVCNHVLHGQTIFWYMLLMLVGVLVIVNLARSTLGIALRPMFERLMSKLPGDNKTPKNKVT